MSHDTARPTAKGFTLIELAIVLVIIGLIVGGVLAGRDLISAAAVRSQIAQIEQLQGAVNTFRGKYGALPGDIPSAEANRFGFIARGTQPGQGDGDGLIAGWYPGSAHALFQDAGETAVFWVDLSKAGLIPGGFKSAISDTLGSSNIVGSQLATWLPEAKIRAGVYIYVGVIMLYDGSWPWTTGNTNYFEVSKVTQIQNGGNGIDNDSAPGFSVREAYLIDKKIDDGMPQQGNVLAEYAARWADPTFTTTTSANYPGGYTTAITGSSTTCYDNGGNAGTQQAYSITQSNGANVTCGLSFKFQ